MTGSGPGVDEDMELYLDPYTLTVCDQRVKKHHMDEDQVQKSLDAVKKILKQ